MCKLTSSSWAIIPYLSQYLSTLPLLLHFFPRLCLFHHTLQRMLVLPGVCRDLLHFGRRHVPRIDPADANAFPMHLQHDLRRALAGQTEEFLYHDDHELHRGVVVVEQHDLEHRGRLQLAALRLQCGVVLELRHSAWSRAVSAPESRTNSRSARSRQVHGAAVSWSAHLLRSILINWGGRCNAPQGLNARFFTI